MLLGPSNMDSSAVNPCLAIQADSTPVRAAWPAWKGLVMVPKFRTSPLIWEAVRPQAARSCCTFSFHSRAATVVQVKAPMVAVECQPRR